MSEAVKPRHIGDGVYVSFDGFNIRIAVNDHNNHVVSLEPSVLGQLIDYARGINKAFDVRHFPVGPKGD